MLADSHSRRHHDQQIRSRTESTDSFSTKGRDYDFDKLEALALEILTGKFKSRGPAEDDVNNDCSIFLSVNTDATRRRDLFPSLVHAVDKYDEDNWTVDWPEGHGIVVEFGGGC